MFFNSYTRAKNKVIKKYTYINLCKLLSYVYETYEDFYFSSSSNYNILLECEKTYKEEPNIVTAYKAYVVQKEILFNIEVLKHKIKHIKWNIKMFLVFFTSWFNLWR